EADAAVSGTVAADHRRVIRQARVGSRGLADRVAAEADLDRAGAGAAGRVGLRGLPVDPEVELARVVGRRADLVHGQRRLAGVRDRAGLVVACGEADAAVSGTVAADHRRVTGQARAGARGLADRVGADRVGGRVLATV